MFEKMLCLDNGRYECFVGLEALLERLDLAKWCVSHGYRDALLKMTEKNILSLKQLQRKILDLSSAEIFVTYVLGFGSDQVASFFKNLHPEPCEPIPTPPPPPPPVTQSRFVEVGLTSEDIAAHINLGSVKGVFDKGVPKFQTATPHLESKVPATPGAAYLATKFARRKLRREVNDGTAQSSTTDCHGLSVDEIAAINLYTQDAVYPTLNEHLRAQDREELKPFFPYLALLLTALMKLPSVPKCVVYRGVKGVDLRSLHPIEETVVWFNFSSCTTDGKVASSFLGPSGPRTLFAVTVEHGKDIQQYSSYKGEKEILVVAGTPMVVENSMEVVGANGLVLINMTEETLPPGVKLIS